MKTILKTTAALFMAAMTPIVGYLFLLAFYMGILVLFPTYNEGSGFLKSDVFLNALQYGVFMALIPVPLVFGHVLLLGVPALLVGWYSRTIRWWSTLITAFLIGAIPSALLIAFAPAGWSGNQALWQHLDAANLGLLIGGSLLMGLSGLSSGLVFWLVWRYWVNPDSPEGRPLTSPLKISDAPEPQ